MKKKNFKRRVQNFTLIEMLVVLIILMLMAGIATPFVMNSLEGAKQKAARAGVEGLSQCADLYILDVGKAPTSLDGLTTNDCGSKKWAGPYSKKKVSKDPWGNDYVYRAPGPDGKAFEIISYGRDGVPGGEGLDADISCWDPADDN